LNRISAPLRHSLLPFDDALLALFEAHKATTGESELVAHLRLPEHVDAAVEGNTAGSDQTQAGPGNLARLAPFLPFLAGCKERARGGVQNDLLRHEDIPTTMNRASDLSEY